MQNKETKKTGLVPKQKSFWPFLIVTFIIVGIIVAGGLFLFRESTDTIYIKAKIGQQNYNLELANTDALRQKGLSERDSLPENGGMLFDFGQDGDWKMWMIQMRFPIDIIWLNKDKGVVHIKNDASPADYPEIYRSPELSRYVVELPSGDVESTGLKVGDTISF
jgi:uncharacterized protein